MCKTHENAKDMYFNISKIHKIIIFMSIHQIYEIIYICQHIRIDEIIYVNTLNVMRNAYGNASNADAHTTCMLLLQ